MTQQTLFDPSSPDFHQNPYPTYRRLREADPIHKHADNTWILTRYHDCLPVLDDLNFRTVEKTRCYSDETLRSKPEGPGAEFVRLRKAVAAALAPSVARKLQPMAQHVADELVDEALAAGKVDLMETFCYPLSTAVFCEIFGVPHADRANFRTWMEPIVAGFDASVGVPDDVLDRRDNAWARFSEYVRALAAERRSNPRDDLISDFLRIQQDGRALTDDELVAASIGLLLAGHEATALMVGNATCALLQHPAELQRLRDDPAMWPTAIEELLRYEPPGQVLMRENDVDFELNGHRIPAGDIVVVSLAAANRDPEVFHDPERLDLGRDPNPHLSFGHGPHFCLGSRLARVEGLTALTTLFTKAPALSLAEQPTYKPTLVLRTLNSLWVELH